jgi:hypothetical protein
MAYLLDANVFIESKKRWYGFDFCSAFWDWLDVANAANRVFSIEKVADELASIEDDLLAWATPRRARMFLPVEPPMLDALRQVTGWVTGQGYQPRAVTTFFEGADYYLIGQALALGYTVVTLELPEATRRKVKIPDVCVGLGFRCVTPFEMLRNERARFVLAATA